MHRRSIRRPWTICLRCVLACPLTTRHLHRSFSSALSVLDGLRCTHAQPYNESLLPYLSGLAPMSAQRQQKESVLQFSTAREGRNLCLCSECLKQPFVSQASHRCRHPVVWWSWARAASSSANRFREHPRFATCWLPGGHSVVFVHRYQLQGLAERDEKMHREDGHSTCIDQQATSWHRSVTTVSWVNFC